MVPITFEVGDLVFITTLGVTGKIISISLVKWDNPEFDIYYVKVGRTGYIHEFNNKELVKVKENI